MKERNYKIVRCTCPVNHAEPLPTTDDRWVRSTVVILFAGAMVYGFAVDKVTWGEFSGVAGMAFAWWFTARQAEKAATATQAAVVQAVTQATASQSNGGTKP